MALLDYLKLTYPDYLKSRYKIELDEALSGEKLLSVVGKKRGCIISGGEVDYNRISAIVLDEFRGGKIGRISLERPGESDIGQQDKDQGH
jgi:ribosome biogenesis GTPase A